MKFNVTEFLNATKEISENKGLEEEDILRALEEALKQAYIRYLGGSTKDMPDPVVTCSIDQEKGTISLAQIKIVRDEVNDDLLEIETEEANEGLKKPKYKDGDEYVIPANEEELSKVFALAAKNNFRQKLSEAERAALYRLYKDRIGEMVTGVVEKSDDRSVIITIGRTTIELTRKELIGDEHFAPGQSIKVYIQEVKTQPGPDGKPRGPQIEATRASEGFLRRLFEEEIREIEEGVVVIKALARKAGVRSKVAVYSTNEDVDATGSCIGAGGTRIQKIVSQLGNAKNKEKIDIINYTPTLGLFICEACRPVHALGCRIEDPDESGRVKAFVIIQDGDLPLALGKFRSNIALASQLTGVSIEFVELSKANELGLTYTTIEEWTSIAEEEKKEQERLSYLRIQEEAARKAEEEASRALEAKKEAEKKEAAKQSAKEPEHVEAPRAQATPEEYPPEAVNPAAAALSAIQAQAKAEEEKKEEPAKEQPEEVEHREVETTTTLGALEAELNAAKEKKSRPSGKAKKPRKITEEEVKREASPVKPAAPQMPIYTEEELAEMEEDEALEADNSVSDEELEDAEYEYGSYYDDEDGR